MTVEFASSVTSLGESIVRTLGNADAVFNESGKPVRGIFRNPLMVAPVGTAGVYAREPQFDCLVTSLQGVNVAERVSVTMNHPAATPAWYLVRERLPDDHHTGMAKFLLEPAP